MVAGLSTYSCTTKLAPRLPSVPNPAGNSSGDCSKGAPTTSRVIMLKWHRRGVTERRCLTWTRKIPEPCAVSEGFTMKVGLSPTGSFAPLFRCFSNSRAPSGRTQPLGINGRASGNRTRSRSRASWHSRCQAERRAPQFNESKGQAGPEVWKQPNEPCNT